MKGRFFYYTLALTTYFFLYGCINLGPDYQRPGLGIQVPESYEFEPTAKQPLEVEDRWWEIFEDGELDQMVEDALKYNWDIKQAAARILEVRARYVQVRSGRFPEVDVGGIRDRRQINGGESRDNFIVDTYELTAAASFELDLWSRLKKASRAAWEDILAEEENRRTVAQAVVAETVFLYLGMEAVERRLQIAEQSIKAFRQSLQFVEIRYRRGLISVLDVRQASRVYWPGLKRWFPSSNRILALFNNSCRCSWADIRRPGHPAGSRKIITTLLAPVPPGLPSDLY